jgi:hypothetical protein
MAGNENMRKFKDKRYSNEVITEYQLRGDFENEKNQGRIDNDMTFEDFLANGLSENGNLIEIK